MNRAERRRAARDARPTVPRTPTVELAYLTDGKPSDAFVQSLIRCRDYELLRTQQLVGVRSRRGRANAIDIARNEVTTMFHRGDGEWLWFVDSDMGFPRDALQKLLWAADPTERPIVGGLCFLHRTDDYDEETNAEIFGTEPTVFLWDVQDDGLIVGFKTVLDYPRDAVCKVDTTGAACILIHRSVIERMHDRYGPNWWTQIPHPTKNRPFGEDTSFFLRCTELGIPLHIHTGVRTSHDKGGIFLTEKVWDAQQRPAAPPHVESATEEVAVLVPVLGRPQHAEPFMRSLRASTGLANAYVMCDPQDTETWDAWVAAGANMRAADGVTFAEKVNQGYRETAEPWVFLVGSDVQFRAGWYDQAVAVANETGKSVIGTNDLGNPRVMRGEHATHILIRRSYIDEQGASWDGPKVVCHEGYRHWYVDDEIVTVAKQRDEFEVALASVVEHLHPIFGKGENDSTYELGQSFAETDARRYQLRAQEHAAA